MPAQCVIESSESVDGKFPVNGDLLKIAQCMDDTDQAPVLYSFKVPVSCWSSYSKIVLTSLLQRHKT